MDKERILLTIQDVMVRPIFHILTMKGQGLFRSPAAGPWDAKPRPPGRVFIYTWENDR